ncbi:hypothetical protein N0V82_004175 [Gnomoniopsis sp. IMI 355080]|nr:hypothetical protein N0V82_004175 [Gnomoniopsis sp. IMI 355080]
MARDYWVEGFDTGRPRFVKIPATSRSHLRRSNTHDGSQSSRGRRVDFLDVTREEHTSLQALNENLMRENAALKANLQTTESDLRRCCRKVPVLETKVRDLESVNAQLRVMVEEGSGGHHHHHHREREDGLRRLRNQNTRLRNDNDALLERITRLERDGVGSGTERRLKEDLRRWKVWYAQLEDKVERLVHKLDSVTRRNKRLEMANESAARQTRELQRDVEYYRAILRRHGFSTR